MTNTAMRPEVAVTVAAEKQALGQVVAARRAELGLTLGQVAELGGFNEDTVYRVESGRNSPTFLYAILLARGLRWTLTELASAVDARADQLRKDGWA